MLGNITSSPKLDIPYQRVRNKIKFGGSNILPPKLGGGIIHFARISLKLGSQRPPSHPMWRTPCISIIVLAPPTSF